MIWNIIKPTHSISTVSIKFYNIYIYRDVAQLVAHYVRDVGVACSSHVIPTKGDNRSNSAVAFSFPLLQLAENKRNTLNTSFSFSVR